MSDTWCAPVVLEGKRVRLEPLAPGHAADLAEACDEHMFDFFPVFPHPLTKDGLESYIEMRVAAPATLPLALIDLSRETAIGSSSYYNINPQHKSLEIGHSWIAKPFRGTYANPEMKLLMLSHVFEQLKAVRVQIITDARNLQSRNAILKLGAKQEGVLRHNMVMPDGHLRDTHVYGILPQEWPAIRAALLRRLKSEP
ncbi:MAG: GNAT family N-acetyltransferase [Armatimonadetes bacterium]|nr:GNAT family N-acetyltransferase [Armatimonadota bacterium]